MSERVEKITVPKGIEPMRLDLFLAGTEIGLSRTQIQKLIRKKKIEVIGKGVKPAFILTGGEEIVITIPPEEPPRRIPEDIPLDIRYEDDDLMVVNKPPEMVVHPARGHYSGTLVHGLVGYTNDLSEPGDPTRPGIVHRLDKDTSGLLIVAKNDLAHRRLSEELAERNIHREYFALVWGHLPGETGSIEGNIGHNPSDHRKMAVVDGGKSARTDYALICDYHLLSSVAFRLHTGRTHQIRVHAEHIGHPVFGDPDYGGRDTHLGGVAPEYRRFSRSLLKLIDRQALHARELSFRHPITAEEITVRCELPGDISAVLDELENFIA